MRYLRKKPSKGIGIPDAHCRYIRVLAPENALRIFRSYAGSPPGGKSHGEKFHAI